MENLKDRVTIYQVAQASGVSLATVSRVINKSGSVTASTRKKVEDTIARLGYRPSGLAQALATNRTTNVGVVIPSANYVYISNLLNGITEIAKEKGYVLTLFSTSHSHDEAISMIGKVITSHVDGAIIFDDQLSHADIENIASYNVPSIVIDSHIKGDRIGSIVFNTDVALEKFVEDYYEKDNKTPITFLHVHNAGRLLSRCEKSFVAVNERLGKEYKVLNTDDSYTRTYNDFLKRFQSEKKGFYIAYRDSIAAAVLNAATDSGLRIPEDIEVMSLVGTKYAAIVRPQLTSMHIDMAEVGKRSMYMLSDLLNQELIDKTYAFDPALVKRSSTDI